MTTKEIFEKAIEQGWKDKVDHDAVMKLLGRPNAIPAMVKKTKLCVARVR